MTTCGLFALSSIPGCCSSSCLSSTCPPGQAFDMKVRMNFWHFGSVRIVGGCSVVTLFITLMMSLSSYGSSFVRQGPVSSVTSNAFFAGRTSLRLCLSKVCECCMCNRNRNKAGDAARSGNFLTIGTNDRVVFKSTFDSGAICTNSVSNGLKNACSAPGSTSGGFSAP